MNTTKARIDRLTAEAVAFIRRAEPLALKMDAQGYYADFLDEYEVLEWWISKKNKEDYLKENRI